MSYFRDMLDVLNAPCKEHTQMLSKRFDAPLSKGAQHGLSLHLFICKGCAAYAKHLRRLRALCEAVGKQTIEQGDAMPGAVRERLTQLTTKGDASSH